MIGNALSPQQIYQCEQRGPWQKPESQCNSTDRKIRITVPADFLMCDPMLNSPVSKWLPAAGQFWPEPCCASDTETVCSSVPCPALPDRQPCLHSNPSPTSSRRPTTWSVAENRVGAHQVLVGAGLHAKEENSLGPCLPCSISLPLPLGLAGA